jgi:hypothetical protein
MSEILQGQKGTMSKILKSDFYGFSSKFIMKLRPALFRQILASADFCWSIVIFSKIGV